jgi:hypothetical protein
MGNTSSIWTETPTKEKYLIQLFDKYDNNKNGFIDRDEFRELMLELVTSLTKEDIEEDLRVEMILDISNFQNYDENNDGQISKEEFVQHLIFVGNKKSTSYQYTSIDSPIVRKEEVYDSIPKIIKKKIIKKDEKEEAIEECLKILLKNLRYFMKTKEYKNMLMEIYYERKEKEEEEENEQIKSSLNKVKEKYEEIKTKEKLKRESKEETKRLETEIQEEKGKFESEMNDIIKGNQERYSINHCLIKNGEMRRNRWITEFEKNLSKYEVKDIVNNDNLIHEKYKEKIQKLILNNIILNQSDEFELGYDEMIKKRLMNHELNYYNYSLNKEKYKRIINLKMEVKELIKNVDDFDIFEKVNSKLGNRKLEGILFMGIEDNFTKFYHEIKLNDEKFEIEFFDILNNNFYNLNSNKLKSNESVTNKVKCFKEKYFFKYFDIIEHLYEKFELKSFEDLFENNIKTKMNNIMKNEDILKEEEDILLYLRKFENEYKSLFLFYFKFKYIFKLCQFTNSLLDTYISIASLLVSIYSFDTFTKNSSFSVIKKEHKFLEIDLFTDKIIPISSLDLNINFNFKQREMNVIDPVEVGFISSFNSLLKNIELLNIHSNDLFIFEFQTFQFDNSNLKDFMISVNSFIQIFQELSIIIPN